MHVSGRRAHSLLCGRARRARVEPRAQRPRAGRTDSSNAASATRANPRRGVRPAGWGCMAGMSHALARVRLRVVAHSRAKRTAQHTLHPRGASARVSRRALQVGSGKPNRREA